MLIILITLAVIRQKGESQNGCYKKTKHAKLPKKRKVLNPQYPHLRVRIRGKEIFVSLFFLFVFFENLAYFVFLQHPF